MVLQTLRLELMKILNVLTQQYSLRKFLDLTLLLHQSRLY